MDLTSKYWDMKSNKMPVGQRYDELLAEHYKRSHLKLLTRWASLTEGQPILKTDLYAEAMCPSRSFLWEMLKPGMRIFGIDISPEICKRAKEMAVSYAPGTDPEFIPCDIRNLTFANNFFDLIFSDSTLDHFANKDDIILSLKELMRTLKPGGTFIITMDNGSNFTEPFFRLWIWLRLSRFYIGKTYTNKELKQVLTSIGMRIEDEAAIIHNPRFFTKMIVSTIRKTFPRQYRRWVGNILEYFDSFENKKWKYSTAQFIAMKATKPFEQ